MLVKIVNGLMSTYRQGHSKHSIVDKSLLDLQESWDMRAGDYSCKRGIVSAIIYVGF